MPRPRQTTRLLTLLGLALFAAAARGQISPGPLAAVHEQLEGSRNCLECHSQGEGAAAEKCLSCHEILAGRIRAGEGLHSQRGYEDCRICHIEHHGRDYELIWWGQGGPDAFDHDLTGEPLAGRHRELGCRDCHRAELVASPQTLLAAGKDLDRTFLGLSTECAACHEDEHRGQFEEAACETCHGVDTFAPAAGFDHGQARFALTGAHADVECGECHREERTANGEPFTRFRPIAHAQCGDCHEDPHDGELGADCASCHATDSWSSTPDFDHGRTRFPLTGRHRAVACDDCHRDTAGELRFQGLPFAACSDCHADPHEGRLGAGCADCHRTDGWDRIADGSFDHATTSFPLLGAHASTECAACHEPGAPLRIAGFERCETCHADEHLGQFAHRDDGGACESCHSEEAFVPAIFSEEDHAESRFPLAGGHRGVACVECHAETTFRRVADGEIVRTAKFRFERLECVECHEDVHAGTADAWLESDRQAPGSCDACHSDTAWTAFDFDHARTAFALDGAHRDVACRDCHAADGATEEARLLRLADTPTDCADCHQDPHGGQFEGRAGGCESCHAATRWVDLVFDHDLAFVLDGAHAKAECEACHLPEGGDSESVVRYTPLPTTCEGCHAGAG